jgi:hypothetical protein
MSMLSLRLPESLHRKVRELASKESISINQIHYHGSGGEDGRLTDRGVLGRARPAGGPSGL